MKIAITCILGLILIGALIALSTRYIPENTPDYRDSGAPPSQNYTLDGAGKISPQTRLSEHDAARPCGECHKEY